MDEYPNDRESEKVAAIREEATILLTLTQLIPPATAGNSLSMTSS